MHKKLSMMWIFSIFHKNGDILKQIEIVERVDEGNIHEFGQECEDVD